MEEIEITTETLNLDQFLKWAGVVETGGQVRLFIEEGLVSVNNLLVTERRKKIHAGDVVEIKGIGQWKATK